MLPTSSAAPKPTQGSFSSQSPNTEIELLKPYRLEAGNCYKAALDAGPWAQELTGLGDSTEKPNQSPVILLEDGQPIGQSHAPHRHIADQGHGSYSHWSSTVYFSTSDNTDPNQNGRSYSLLINRGFGREQRMANAVVEFLRSRLAELGPAESGFYDYYARFAETGAPFQVYDQAIVRFILERADRHERYVEIGAGIGQLVALLAGEGLNAIAVEGDIHRVNASIAMREVLSREIEGFKDRMSVIQAFFPDKQVGIDRETTVLFTNVIHSNANEDGMLMACRDAAAIVMDVCRFGRSRTTTDEWRTLIRRVRDLGFSYVDPIFSWGESTMENQKSPSCGRILYFHRGPQLSSSPKRA